MIDFGSKGFSQVSNHIEDLRSILVGVLSWGSWSIIQDDFEKVKLPWREDLGPGWGKPAYVERVLAEVDAIELVELGNRCLAALPDRSPFRLQEALWWIEADGRQLVTEVTRLAVADFLDGRRMHPDEEPVEFLSKFGRFGDYSKPTIAYGNDLTLYSDGPLKGNKGDILSLLATKEGPKWTRARHRDVLDLLGFRHWPDKRFIGFVEALVHPTTRQAEAQAQWVEALAKFLEPDGFKLSIAESMSGHPLYRVRRREWGVSGKPKNLIFASAGPKPEIGFLDAVNNDIVILKHEEHCLVYQDPLEGDGLAWDRLAEWWSRQRGTQAVTPETRKELADRLLASTGSEPEKMLFKAYFKAYRVTLKERLPALLPQVYLHYDPVTVGELRDRQERRRFLVQRMDFLLLLPGGIRVVLEVDGQQHYAEGEGKAARPSPKRYAETVQGDRGLRLAGYEVYRFAGYELVDKSRAEHTVREFFDRLFQRHGLLPVRSMAQSRHSNCGSP